MRSKWWPTGLKILLAAGIVYAAQRNLPLKAADLLQFMLHAKVSFYISMVVFAIFLMLQAGIWVLIVNTAGRAGSEGTISAGRAGSTGPTIGTAGTPAAAGSTGPTNAGATGSTPVTASVDTTGPTTGNAGTPAAAGSASATSAGIGTAGPADGAAADTPGGAPPPPPKLAMLQGLRLFINSQFAKYIPGGFWNYAGRIVLATQAGIPLPAQLAAIVYENVLLVLAACAYALLLAVELSRAPGLLVGGALAAALGLYAGYAPLTARLSRSFAAASHWKPLQPLLRRLHLWLPGPTAEPSPKWALLSRNQFFACWGCFLASHFVMGIAFWLLCNSFGAGRITLLYAAGTFATSWLLGLLSPLPGGLGVREGFLVYFLSLKLGTEAAVHISVIARVWNIMAELTFWMLIQIISRLAGKVRWYEA